MISPKYDIVIIGGSPAATASLSIGQAIADMAEKNFEFSG